jgi:hypothetical protein
MPVLKADEGFASCVENLVSSYQEGARLLTQARRLLERNEDQRGKVRSGDLEQIIEGYRRETWKRIMSRLFMQNKVGPKCLQRLQEQVQADSVPELTMNSIAVLTQDATSNEMH